MDTVDLAIVGATGTVGEVVVELLEKSTFPVNQLYLLASQRTAGTSLLFRSQPLMVNIVDDFDFSQVQIVIFVANDQVSQQYVPKAQAAGCLVIDNSQAFDTKSATAPLIIPSVNGDLLSTMDKPSLVINPDSTVVTLWTVLKPVYDAVGLRRVNVTVCDSVSRHGKKAMRELATQTAGLLNGQGANPGFFSQQIAFNILPCVGKVDKNGHSEAEVRIVEQTNAIIGDSCLQLDVTCIQVPVFYADSMAVTIETDDVITVNEVYRLLEKNKEIKLLDDIEDQKFATPVSSASGNNDIFVSRIRQHMGYGSGINLWIVADNVRKGAAFNSVLIAEELKKNYL